MNENKLIAQISEMNHEDVQTIALQWAQEEGWNPGIDDAKAFYAQDPHGFFVEQLNGKPIGCCSAVIYDPHFAFFGLYIVKNEYRHQGYGMRMTRHCLEYVGKRNFGLDGVVKMVDEYAKIGFSFAHFNIRYQGKLRAATEYNSSIREIPSSNLEEIEVFDRRYFPAPRRAFLRAWLETNANQRSLAYKVDGKVKGYGTIRRCQVGYKIGPLFAESFDIAEALFQSLAALSNGEVIFLDIPEPNHEAKRLVHGYGMEECFRTVRMYTQAPPDLQIEGIFGVTTFELG